MKIERCWKPMARILGAMAIAVGLLLSGCGGSTQGASSESDPSSAAAVTPPVSTGSDSPTGTDSTPIASTPGASSPVASTPVSSSGSSSGATTSSTNVTLSWSAPTENTNGSALTNLAGYIIYYGTSASAMTQTIDINTVGMLTYVVDNLSAGSWYFQIVAVNSAGEQSTPSATVNASI